jgi:Glyoxalase-like domain
MTGIGRLSGIALDCRDPAVLALGGSTCEHQPDREHVRVMADPAGHVFCLCQARH